MEINFLLISLVKIRIKKFGKKQAAIVNAKPTALESLKAIPVSVSIDAQSFLPQYCAVNIASPEPNPIKNIVNKNCTCPANEEAANAVCPT